MPSIPPAVDPESRFSTESVLFATTVLALALRVFWVFSQTGVIENEGAEYARTAENLLAGRGYVGILGGVSAWMPPMYPALIAVGTLLTGSAELGGRLMSAGLGALMVTAIGLIARDVYGRPAALLAGLLAACHPLLIALSGTVYSEGPYLSLVAWGIWLAIRARGADRQRAAAGSGVLFALAYLTRPEALLFPPCAAMFVAVFGRTHLRRRLQGAALLLAGFLVVIAPYVIAIWLKSGVLTVAPKGPVNNAITQRMLQGMSYGKAMWEIDDTGREVGIGYRTWIRDPWGALGGSKQGGTNSPLAYVATPAIGNAIETLRRLAGGPMFGAPALFGLVLLGLLGASWGRERLVAEAFLIVSLTCIAVPLLTVQHGFDRYFFPLVLIPVVWASRGLEHAGRWALDTARANGASRILARGAGAVVPLLLGALVVGLSARGLSEVGDLQQGLRRDALERRAGTWLRGAGAEGKTVMSVSNRPPFYAGGVWRPYPVSSGDAALRYVDLQGIDYLVVRTAQEGRPYLDGWIRDGLRDPRAELVYEAEGPGNDRIRVYRWRKQG